MFNQGCSSTSISGDRNIVQARSSCDWNLFLMASTEILGIVPPRGSVIRTQCQALDCIQFPHAFFIDWGTWWRDATRLRGSGRLLNLPASWWHRLWRRAATRSLEVDWLHLWSLFRDNGPLFNHALCCCSLQGCDCYQQLRHCLLLKAILIGRYFLLGVLILFTYRPAFVLRVESRDLAWVSQTNLLKT